MERSNPLGLLSPGSPPSPLWSRASSSSSLSSSFRAESFDFRAYPPQSELEEVPSLRWLPGDLSPPAASTRRSATERSWSEGYIHLCKCEGHRKASDGRSFAFKDSINGQKCLFLPVYALMVREDEGQFWRCTDAYKEGKRSLHAVDLLRGYYLDIRWTVDVAPLPSATEYAVHLVFRFSERSFGFGLQEASLEIGAQTSKQNICLQPEGCGIAGGAAGKAEIAMVPQEYADGWMSIEMGRFFMETRSSGERKLFVGLTEGGKVDRNRMSWGEEMDVLRWKEGLVIGGVLVKTKVMDHGVGGLVRRLGSLALDKSKGFRQQRKRN
ncbi:hypothetical protein Taro_016142 [Colocasia esculenta]|uniref:Uncharacterized protein n=1 Tax=Colocasia esculenta TaxID=4460 RepID=A0A843UMS3_COLES|nr:hypothetical protein [Colocasia esculenta]